METGVGILHCWSRSRRAGEPRRDGYRRPVTEVRPGQAWTNDDGDRFVVVGRLTDGTGWAVSRGKVEIERVLDELAQRADVSRRRLFPCRRSSFLRIWTG
jgi:hypothetical protein